MTTTVTIQASDLASVGDKVIALDDRYKALKTELEDVKVQRNLALEEAYELGVRTYKDHTIYKTAPPTTVTSESICDYDVANGTDLLGEYLEWYRKECEVKVTASAFGRFLSEMHPDLADGIREAVTVPADTDRCEYAIRVRKVKE